MPNEPVIIGEGAESSEELIDADAGGFGTCNLPIFN